MAQFSIYENRNPAHYDGKPITRLNPMIELNARHYLALTQQLAGVERKMLGQEVGQVLAYRDQLLAALDFITSGI